MARHAEFSAAASLNEDTVNKVIATYFQQAQGPFFFPMPQTVGVGANNVTFAGVVQLDPPTVELHANPGNLITAHFTFRTTVRAQPAGAAMQTWTLQFNVTGNTVLVPQIQNNQVVVTLSAAQTALSLIEVRVLAGPPLPAIALSALQSAEFASFLTRILQALVPFIASPPLLTTRFTRTQPGEFKDSGYSVFDWFTIDITANRIFARPLEKAISVGIDFAGFSQGDPNQLVDLTTVRGSGSLYYRVVYQTTDLAAPPILQRQVEPSGSDLAIAFNMNVLRQIVATQVSPRIAGTPIRKNVRLFTTSLGYAEFNKPLRGREDGLDLHFTAAFVKGALSVIANGDVYIQAYLQTWDGPSNFIRADSWRIYIAYVDLDLPAWAEILIGILEFVFQVLSLVALMVTMFNLAINQMVADFVQSVLDAAGQADSGNIAVTAQGTLQGEANKTEITGSWSTPLPNTTFPRWDGILQNLSFTNESLDAGIKTWINWNDAAPKPPAVILPASWPASDRRSIQVSLKLRNDLAKLAGNNLLLAWQVTRNDTGTTVATATIRYDVGLNNGPVIAHHSRELYTVNSFTVRCTATITLGSQVGEIWSGQETLTIDDILDRSHSFVEWGPHTVYFEAPDFSLEHPDYWSHIRRSRIHRTAVAARCRMVKLKAASVAADSLERERHGPPLKYRDSLGFSWERLSFHRKVLCEYCFFGGPDKTTAFPRDDWFEPMPSFVASVSVFPP
jgi:hypothetical protein